MNGTVQTLEFTDVKVHVYTPPEDGFRVNSTIIELRDRLIVVDGQLFERFAREVGDLIDGLRKPIDRFVLTHNHPDHYSGFEYLTQRFAGVQLASLPEVRDYLASLGEHVLEVRRGLFGDQVAAHVVVPDALIVPGELVISGVRFLFQRFDEAEAEHTLTITLPDQGVALVADLVGGASDHLFTVRPHFDSWIAVLEKLRVDTAKFGLKTFVIGHGASVGPEALPANIEYLKAAKAAYQSSAKADEWVAAVGASLPERGPDAWVNWSSQMLYGHVAP